MISKAEDRFPVRIRVEQPPGGLGQRLDRMHAWLDETCGADGWMTTPAGTLGIVNDAFAVYFRDATLAAAFVARWCAGFARVQGFYQLREDDPAPRIPAKPHSTFGGSH